MKQRPRKLLIVAYTNRYGLSVLSGIHSYCRSKGNWEYRVEVASNRSVMERLRFAVRDWKAEGIILLSESAAMERLVVDSGTPAVNFNGYCPSNLPTVMSDNVAIARLAAQHLMNNGCRNFAFCARTTELSPLERCQAFSHELKRNGFGCEIFTDLFRGESEKNWVRNRARMYEWLLSLKKPVGMMCSHDHRGQEVSWACRRAGLRVPDEVALVAVGDDHVLCQMCSPPLSSVNTDGQRIGYESARLVHRLMRGGKPPAKPILVPPIGISARQSSDIIGIDDVEVATAVRFIRDHAHMPISVKDLLEEVAISRRALERRFERAIGRMPKEEIMRVRINRAKELLATSNLLVASIARHSGFSHPDKLSVAFRRETGQTPSEYRRQFSMAQM